MYISSMCADNVREAQAVVTTRSCAHNACIVSLLAGLGGAVGFSFGSVLLYS